MSHYSLQYWFEFLPALILFLMDMLEMFVEDYSTHTAVWTEVMY